MATYEDLTIDRGTDTTIRLELVDENGNAKNLTNFSASAKMKKTYNSTDSGDVYLFSTQIQSPATDGILNLTLTNSQTDTMKPGRYVYDAEISFVDSDSNTIRERILEGRITVTPSVTR